jgi:hypothetical protein
MKNSDKIILDLCGGTGSWSKPYKDAGYDVRVITLPEDVRDWIAPDNVYGILAAPPCTEFSKAKHFHGKGNYTHDFKEGLSIADACMRIAHFRSPSFFALENPNGYLKRWYGNPIYTFEPWQFGDKYQKTTCLWGWFIFPFAHVDEKPEGLKKFSMLKSHEIAPEYYGKLTRQERRAITPPGFAKAFFEANQ